MEKVILTLVDVEIILQLFENVVALLQFFVLPTGEVL
jgi:hypothetical protein